MKGLAVFLFILSTYGYSQDLTGQWKGSVEEQFDISVHFQVNQSKLTAKVSSDLGEAVFENGKILGDALSFDEVSFNGITISSLKGKVKDGTIKFVAVFQGQNMNGVLVRVK